VIEQWHIVILEPGPRPALVLDVSESAQKLAPYLRSLAEGVLEALPEANRPRLFFLGNPQPFDPAEFPAMSERWFAQNSGRGSFIAPIFEYLANEPSTATAIAGAGRIFDLGDWRGHPLAERAIWAKVGPVGLTDGVYPEETYTCEQLAERLNNPPVRVEVWGDGMIPFFWDDPSFQFDHGKLVGSRNNGTMLVGTLAPEADLIRAAVLQANGTRRTLALSPAEAPALSDWFKLPMSELNLLNQCRRTGRYQCPVCHTDHPFGQFRCNRPGARPIFSTLDALPRGGFCLLDSSAWETKYRYHPCAGLQLAPDAVAVRTADGGAEIWRFDGHANVWTSNGERLKTLHPLGHKLDAMVL
jgi:hypothetical protein